MGCVELELPFGRTTLRAAVPRQSFMGILTANEGDNVSADSRDENALIRDALAHPIGSPCLRALARPGQRVAIISSDLTRPCPSDRILPLVLDELSAAGVRDADVTIIMALGLHRAMTDQEIAQAVGQETCSRVHVLNHDPHNVVRLGVTSRGTPVELFGPVVDVDLRVCLGNLELHYFAGYSGGVKAVLPGCASETTVRANHAMMTNPGAVAGRIEGNPVRADIEEGVALVGVDFILNVLVDDRKRIVGTVAGDPIAAHRAGCEQVARRGKVSIPHRADVVVVSAGGYPKDINLYQAQKALDNAAHAVREGGAIVLVAECPEGLGNRTFEQWMSAAHKPDDLLARIKHEFALGGHKAAAIAAVLKRAQVYLMSALPQEAVRICGMTPIDSLSDGISAALGSAGPEATLLAIPNGGSVLPSVSEE